MTGADTDAGRPGRPRGRSRSPCSRRTRPSGRSGCTCSADHAGAQRGGDLERLGALVGPDPGGEAVGRVVGLLDRLGLRAERQHRDDGAEDLLGGDAVRGGDAGEQGGGEPVAALGQRGRDGAPHRALLLAGRDERLDARELLGRVDRADVGVLVERVADAQPGHAVPQPRDHLVGHALLDEQARSGAAHVSLVEEDAVDDPLDGLVERRVLEDDVRRLAAELERQPDVAPGRRRLDVAADGGRAG